MHTCQILLFCVAASVVTLAAGEGAAKSWNFDADKPGQIAAGFTAAVGQWQVVADEAAPSKPNALAQMAKSEKPVYNIALVADAKFKDVDISVKMKSVAGEIDQGGGVVWRAKDAKTYYVARFNPLEENFRLYHIVDGKRTQIKSADAKAAAGWQTLRVTMKGDQIECFLDGQKHIAVTDATLPDAGAVGLWTKADAQTHFDDLTVSGQ